MTNFDECMVCWLMSAGKIVRFDAQDFGNGFHKVSHECRALVGTYLSRNTKQCNPFRVERACGIESAKGFDRHKFHMTASFTNDG